MQLQFFAGRAEETDISMHFASVFFLHNGKHTFSRKEHMIHTWICFVGGLEQITKRG